MRFRYLVLSFLWVCLISPVLSSYALDTDIYQLNVKQNAYILLDNSGSMDYGVYESNVNYGAMYDYLYDIAGIDDTIYTSTPTAWYGLHYEKTKIYLVMGKIRAQIINIDGENRVFTGDAADPDYIWYSNNMVDTHTYIDTLGNLSGEAGETQRVTVDADGHVLFDGSRLPLGQDMLLQDFVTLYDGSSINEGFGGLLNAPGYYFSGYEGVVAGSLNPVEDGDEYIYFFITGNWMNMQQMYNLHYTVNPPGAPAAGDPAWKYEVYPLNPSDWSPVSYNLDYPTGTLNYENNLDGPDTLRTITHAGAESIQIHFSMFDVQGDGNLNNFNRDYVSIYDGSNNLIARYDNDNSPQGDWSVTVSGDTVRITLDTNNSQTRQGYTIDQYRISYEASGGYLMQNRLDVAKDAMLYVVDEFRGKINWGFASFAYTGTTANGATFGPFLNPTDNDDANRAAIVTQLDNTEPMYGTPLGEALQDVFEDGYYGKRNSLDNLMCRKNYTIVVSDGYPSGDDDWNRISGVTFTDADGDGFTADPYQYANPPANYYDDVAHWIYTHSWLDKSEIADPANSYENIIPHQIAFGAKHPLMRDAAEEAGAEYITAYNKTQLVNAFYSLGLMISEAVSFTAPVVSVDEANKVQNGDDLYMGQFLPMDSYYWPGNMKKFVLGDGSVDRPDFWMIYDESNDPATDSDGRFLDNTNGFWGDENDSNDSDNYGGPDIQEDGVGEVLTERVAGYFTSGNYYQRLIKTVLSGNYIDLSRTDEASMTAAEKLTALTAIFGDVGTSYNVINWAHGYSFAADASGDPVAPRDWALGAIVHSRPTVIDYYNSSDFSVVEDRYIVVGSNDGMLHVFDDETGAEVYAFVPGDILPKLSAYETEYNRPLVDGLVKLFREDGQPKYLFFGLRRGGSSYWRIDVSDPNPEAWTVSQFSDSELGQSWSDIEFAKIRTGVDTYSDVAIFSGGYDVTEDNFPEPFSDQDSNGTPYAANGNIDNQEWKASDSNNDVYDNDTYDVMNPDIDVSGRAIYVVDVETLAVRFSVKYDATTDTPSLGTFSSVTNQTRTDMKYCFPATPSVVTLTQTYVDSSSLYQRENNALAAIYAPDIYGNLFRIVYDYDGGSPKWQVQHVFSANPGGTNQSGDDALWQAADAGDTGRKVFYGPAVSWRGSGRYFDPGNYFLSGADFYNQNTIASIFFGTGDREHPSYKIAKNRIYAIYDDSPVYAWTTSKVAVSSVPYDESDLLNITCDELGINTGQDGLTSVQLSSYKQGLQTLLYDDATNPSNALEFGTGGSGENDAKGWYIVLEQQGLSPYCDHCDYAGTVDTSEGGRDYHVGEKVLSKLTLFDGILYFTTYQPSYDDPCAPQGNAFTYALNYLNGAAALNLNEYNDVTTGTVTTTYKDVTDRYGKFTAIKGIPSSFEIVIRNGEAAAMSSVGGSIIGGGEDGYEIPYEDSGLDLYYWLEK